jgi:hypothetical protein
MMENKVVAHLKDGRIHKGLTHDFDPDEPTFHLLPAEGGGVPVRLNIEDMKALFYVKDYFGNREFVPRHRFDSAADGARRAIVTFTDGEVIYGISHASDEMPRGFFLSPADPDDNNVRIFVVRSSVRSLQFME